MESWNNGSPTPEFNNAAQAWNHTFYWESMSPSPHWCAGFPSWCPQVLIDSPFEATTSCVAVQTVDTASCCSFCS